MRDRLVGESFTVGEIEENSFIRDSHEKDVVLVDAVAKMGLKECHTLNDPQKLLI